MRLINFFKSFSKIDARDRQIKIFISVSYTRHFCNRCDPNLVSMHLRGQEVNKIIHISRQTVNTGNGNFAHFRL